MKLKKYLYILIAVLLIGTMYGVNRSKQKATRVNLKEYAIQLPTIQAYNDYFQVNAENVGSAENEYIFQSRNYSEPGEDYSTSYPLHDLPMHIYLMTFAKDQVSIQEQGHDIAHYYQSMEEGNKVIKNENYSLYCIEHEGETYSFNGIAYEDEHIVICYFCEEINFYDLSDEQGIYKVVDYVESLHHLIVKDKEPNSFFVEPLNYNKQKKEAMDTNLIVKVERKVGNALLISIFNPNEFGYDSIEIQGNYDGIYRNYTIHQVPAMSENLYAIEGAVVSDEKVVSFVDYENVDFYITAVGTKNTIKDATDLVNATLKVDHDYNGHIGQVKTDSEHTICVNSYAMINDELYTISGNHYDDHETTVVTSKEPTEITVNKRVANMHSSYDLYKWDYISNYLETLEITEDDQVEFIVGNCYYIN